MREHSTWWAVGPILLWGAFCRMTISMWTSSSKEWQAQAYSHPYRMNSRSIGAADLAYAILSEGKHAHRVSGALAYHALEVMHSFEEGGRRARVSSSSASSHASVDYRGPALVSPQHFF